MDKKFLKDINNVYLPENLDNVEKIHCSLETGKRVYWYYTEDKEFFENEDELARNHLKDIYSGIIVPTPDTESNRGELDFDKCVLVMDTYPVEKEYCQVVWMTLGRLLDNPDLVEVFDE